MADLQYITFWMDHKFYGINILDVKEVNSEFYITPVFHSPKSVLGYVNLRGQLFLIIDLNPVIGAEALNYSSEQYSKGKLIIFKERVGESFGIFVDRVGDVLTIENEKIEEFNSINSEKEESDLEKSRLIDGIVKLEDGLLTIVNAKEIILDQNNIS